jgi:hypothetical protein
MQTIDRTQSHSRSHGALLAGAALLAALAFATPGEAFAACGGGTGGTGGSTGAKPPSTGTGGTHAGSTPSAGSTGASGCGVNATRSALSSGGLAPSLAGVHTGVITGNGGKRNGATTSKTASTVNNSRNTAASTARIANVAGGAVRTGGGARFFHGKRP